MKIAKACTASIIGVYSVSFSEARAQQIPIDINKPLIIKTAESRNDFDNCLRFNEGSIGECRLKHGGNSLTSEAQDTSILSTSAVYFYKNQQAIKSDPLNFLTREGTRLISQEMTNAINKQIKKIPFFAQTTVGADFSQGAAASYFLDSFMKLAELGKDAEGDPKGLVFAQARYSAAYGFEGSTINTGIGTRYRISDNSMLGINGFWDYRLMTSYTSHSRFGVGAEVFYSDLELRNNWYIAGTGAKVISSDALSTTYERVVPGWDVELGYRLPKYPQLGFFLKGFNWDYVSRPDNMGLGASMNWQATPHFNVEATVSNEVPTYLTYATSNNSDVFVGIKLKYTFNPVTLSKNNTKQRLLEILQQPVRRRYDVLLERYTVSTLNGFAAIVVAQ